MCSEVSPKIYETLKKAIQGNIEDFKIVVHDPNKKGDGFLGEMIYVTLQNKHSNEALALVVKQAFTTQNIRDTNPIREVFMNEIYFYNQVWTRLNKFQERIPMENQFHKLAKYFTSITEDVSEKIVLENLKFKNFEVHNKKLPLSKEQYELIFKEYGKFHALSFAYKALYPEDYDELTKNIIDVYHDFMGRDGFSNALKTTNEIAMESLQPGVDDVVIEKFKPYIENYVELFKDSIDSNIKYSVITHGDCWSNNMMFKYSEEKKVVDVRFLDFQLMKIGSPCCDLSYSFYSGASEDLLRELDHFLQVYHDSLSKTLKAFGCDAEKLYPFRELKNDWKQHCKMGVMMALMIWKIKFTFEENIFDLTDTGTMSEEEMAEAYHNGYDKEGFNKTARSIIFHLHENDFL